MLMDYIRVTSEYLWPFAEDVTRFDFEVEQEDESILDKMGFIGNSK